MQIIRPTNLFLLSFAIILCIYSLYITAEIRTFAYEEEIVDSYGPDARLRVLKARTYDDGTAVIRIIRLATASCSFEKLSLRIIHPNGTVVEKDIELDIQPFNFCIFVNPNPVADLNITDPNIEFLDYRLIRKNHILVTYYNATNPNNINDIHTYHWGMIIDFDGNVFSRALFGPAFFDQQSQSIIPNAFIQLNINREKGFLRFVPINNSRGAEWQQYKVETDGTITRLTSGIIPIYIYRSSLGTTLSTIDEGYAIVFTNTSIPSDPLSPLKLFVVNIGYNQTATLPLLLYQTPLPNLAFPSLSCEVALTGVGQVCTLVVKQTDPTGVSPAKTFYVKINFLSSGSVLSLTTFTVSSPPEYTGIVMNSLPFGGYLMTIRTQQINSTDSLIFGYLLDENSGSYTNWELQEPEQTSLFGVYVILPHNNTLLLSQPDSNSYSWQFKVIDLPKFTVLTDKGYSNVNVAGTLPEIQSSVSPDIPKISIDFYNQVDLSVGKLSIYQLDDEQPYLRQSISADSCLFENGGRTVSATVLGSTFSVSNGNYFIQVDNNFVKDRVYKEPLLGIREHVWKFTTTQQKIDKFAPSTTGLLRLAANGTQAFDNLSQEQRNDFFDILLRELSVVVPVSRSRLSTSRKVQLDDSRNYLIPISIEESRRVYDISVVSIVKVIDIMVKNRDQTPIGLTGHVTASYLDSSYGFRPSPNLWEQYKFRILGIFLFIGLLVVLYLLAQRKDNNGNNIAILQLGVIIFDLIMDILFVSNDARNVPTLYIPSILFVIMPIGLNIILAFYIITQESTRPNFFQWFMAHGKVALIFTILAGADIGVLYILHSNLAGLQYFRAPFSYSAKSMIFWSACVNIFTGNIPQIIIQIFYKSLTVTYDIIPLLTLISSSLHLTINVISRLYQATNLVIDQNVSNYYSYDSDDSDLDDSDDLDAIILPSDTSNKKKIKKKQ